VSRLLNSILLLGLVIVSLLVTALPILEAVVLPPIPPNMRIYYIDGTYSDPIIIRAGEEVSIYINANFNESRIWLWLSTNNDTVISPSDAYYAGPFNVSDVIDTEIKTVNFTPPPPFDGENRTYTFTVGNRWINGTLPLFVMGGVEYWIKLTDMSPDNYPNIPAEYILVSENRIVFYDTETCTASPESNSTLPPLTPITVSCVYVEVNKTYNITQVVNSEEVYWRSATIREYSVNTSYGTTWVYRGFSEQIELYDKGLRRTNDDMYYTVSVNVVRINSSAIIETFTYTVQAREVYLSGLGVPRDLYYHGGDYSGSVILKRGEQYTVEVNWFAYKGSINIYLGTTLLASNIGLNETGGAVVSIVVPKTLRSGNYTFRVVDSNNVEYNFTVSIVLVPWIEVEPAEGHVGDRVTVKGYDFDDYINETITILFEGCYGLEVVANFTVTQSNWTQPIVVPTAPGGLRYIYVGDVNGGPLTDPYGNTIYTTFVIKPKLEFDKTSIPSDYTGTIKLRGTGFDPGEVFWVTLDNQFMGIAICNECGYFEVVLPGGGFRPGLHVVAIYGTIETSRGYISNLSDLRAYLHFNVTEEGDIIANIITSNFESLISILEGLNATVVEIRNDVAVIKTDVGEILVKLDDLASLINDIRDEILMRIDVIDSKVELILNNTVEIKFDLKAALEFLEYINATVVEIRNDVAVIESDVGRILLELQGLRSLIEEYGNATITEIEDGIAVIQAYIGDINTSILAKLSALNATIVDVIGEGILRLETSIGAVQANLSVIRELIESSREVILARIENSTLKLQGEFGEIKIKLDNINETVLRVLLSGISDIKDQISTSTDSITSGIGYLRARVDVVESTVRAIKSDTENINNNVATVPTVSTAIWLAVVFSLIAAILSALVTIGVRVKIAS